MTLRGTAVMLALTCAGAMAQAQERRIAPQELKSGLSFASPEVRAMQQDDFSNPGMLWVEKGGRLWSAPEGATKRACSSCHGDAQTSMKGVAARYPAIDRDSGELLDLEARIMQCRNTRQEAAPFKHESEELLALGAFVAYQSRGMPLAVSIDGLARAHFEAGRAFYDRRIGQVNLACAHCHDANWGRTLLTERISQGHPSAYPAYRTEWQTVGSIGRRLRACMSGVRAEMLPYGAPEYRDLELFLSWRAQGLPIETPGVRR